MFVDFSARVSGESYFMSLYGACVFVLDFGLLFFSLMYNYVVHYKEFSILTALVDWCR